jgi:hypothetical protein
MLRHIHVWAEDKRLSRINGSLIIEGGLEIHEGEKEISVMTPST